MTPPVLCSAVTIIASWNPFLRYKSNRPWTTVFWHQYKKRYTFALRASKNLSLFYSAKMSKMTHFHPTSAQFSCKNRALIAWNVYADLSGPNRTNRLSLRIDARFEETNLMFANRPSKKRVSSDDWTRITRISMRIGEKTPFPRIWPAASKVGMFLRIDSRELTPKTRVLSAFGPKMPFASGTPVLRKQRVLEPQTL